MSDRNIASGAGEQAPAGTGSSRGAGSPRSGRRLMDAVRRSYDVPAARGREVIWLGDKTPTTARILSSTGSHLYLRATDGRRIGPCHPCWAIDYQDGRGDRTGQPTPMDRAVPVGMSEGVGIMPGGFFAELLKGRRPVSGSGHTEREEA